MGFESLKKFLLLNSFEGVTEHPLGNKNCVWASDAKTGSTLIFPEDLSASECLEKINDSRQSFEDNEK